MFTIRKEAIIQSVMARLHADFRTGDQTIDVVLMNEDVVVLVGFCDSEEQRALAVTLASGTCGVDQVIDKIEVRTHHRVCAI